MRVVVPRNGSPPDPNIVQVHEVGETAGQAFVSLMGIIAAAVNAIVAWSRALRAPRALASREDPAPTSGGIARTSR